MYQDVTEMSREQLENALIHQTKVAQRWEQRFKYLEKEANDLQREFLQLGHMALTMQQLAQEIIKVGSNGKNNYTQTAPLGRPTNTEPPEL